MGVRLNPIFIAIIYYCLPGLSAFTMSNTLYMNELCAVTLISVFSLLLNGIMRHLHLHINVF